jgi:uncharacterized protein
MKMTEYKPGTPSWVDLGTPDMDASKAFYGALFGWDGRTAEDPAAGGYTMFELGGVAVAGAGPLMSPQQPPAWTTYVSVEDADKTAETVTANGGAVVMPAMDVLDVGRMAIFSDPQVGVFAVWQPRAHKGAGLVNEPGTIIWNELATRDAAGAKAFYPEVFGWTFQTRSMDDGGPEYTSWHVAARPIGGMLQIDENFPPDMPTTWQVYFATADCDASAAKVTELGGSVVAPPSHIPTVGRFAVCQDPQGALFALLAAIDPPQS